MPIARMMRALIGVLACLPGAVAVGDSLDPESNTDGFNPAAQLYATSEAQRQDLIARQIDLNYRMIWSAGYRPAYVRGLETWPAVPGDIWGYPRPRPIEHPVGHESRQTGPNRWIYRPLYAVDVQPAPPAQAKPLRGSNVSRVELPGPSDLEPQGFFPPAPRKNKAPAGPREF
jgi:hypothetical protein